jgi:hypothetical protein
VPSTTRPPVQQPLKLFADDAFFNPRHADDQRLGISAEDSLPLVPEKILEQGSALFGEHAGSYLRAVIEARMAKQISDGPSHAGLFIPCAKHYALHSGEDNGSSAHRARLEGHIKRALIKTPAVEPGRGLANCEHLRVRSRILIADSAIRGGGDYRSVADDHRTNRHFVALDCLSSEIERVANVLSVGL